MNGVSEMPFDRLRANGCGGFWANGCGGFWANGCGGFWANGCGGFWANRGFGFGETGDFSPVAAHHRFLLFSAPPFDLLFGGEGFFADSTGL